jgi:hypothetical protein
MDKLSGDGDRRRRAARAGDRADRAGLADEGLLAERLDRQRAPGRRSRDAPQLPPLLRHRHHPRLGPPRRFSECGAMQESELEPLLLSMAGRVWLVGRTSVRGRGTSAPTPTAGGAAGHALAAQANRVARRLASPAPGSRPSPTTAASDRPHRRPRRALRFLPADLAHGSTRRVTPGGPATRAPRRRIGPRDTTPRWPRRPDGDRRLPRLVAHRASRRRASIAARALARALRSRATSS